MNELKSDQRSSEMSQVTGKTLAVTRDGFNSRVLWPDMIKTPENEWWFSCDDIVNKLGTDPQAAHEMKKRMEKCLMYFYVMKKQLKLFDHTYTAACVLFFRYWYVYGLPSSLPECIQLSQAILVTACKTMENNRPIDAFVKSTCEFLMKDMPPSRARQNVEKLRWDLRDKLVLYEKQILCQLGFDLDIQNPKELIEEIFGGYFRYNRDLKVSEQFRHVFPKIIQEGRNFIIQAGTQPLSLLCDGFSITVLSLVYCGLQYKSEVDNTFRFPKNFFSERFPIPVSSEQLAKLFEDYKRLEENFFDLKSNKGQKLNISREDIDSLIEEDADVSRPVDQEKNTYVYEDIKDGEVTNEFLEHIEARIQELHEKTVAQSKLSHKRPNDDLSALNEPPKKVPK